MKKSLSLLLAIAMVFTMVASVAFADTAASGSGSSGSATTATYATYTTQEKYDLLVTAGIFEGDADGLPHLDAKMTRAQFAKILALVFGLKEDAAAASKAYSDLDGAGWAAGFIGAVTKAGLMEGDAGKFFPGSDVKIEELATVLVRAAKLTPVAGAKVDGADAWAGPYVKAAIDAKLIPAQDDFTKPALRALLVEAAYTAYTTLKPTPTPTAKPTPTPTPTPTPAALTKVNTISNSRIETVFSNVYTSGLKATDFTVKSTSGTDVAVKSIAVRADQTKVFVNTDPMTAGSSYTVTVGGASQTFVAKPADGTAPSIVWANAITPKLVRVAFPSDTDVDTLVAANFSLNNNLKINGATVDTDYNSSSSANPNGYVAVLLSTDTQTPSTLYSVTVNNVKDLAGNVISTNATANFAGAAADTTAPTVVSAAATSKGYVNVYFNEASQLDVASATNIANYTIAGLTITKAEIAKNVLGSTTLGDKVVRLYIKEAMSASTLYTVSVNNIADILGNVLTTASTSNFAGVALDTTALKLQTAVALTNTTVKLGFDDVVGEGATNPANYTIAGLTISAAAYDDTDASYDSITKQGNAILLTTSTQTGGTLYTAKVANLKDNMGNGLDSSYLSVNFGGAYPDTTGPSVQSAVASANTVVVTFNESVDKATAENVLNYTIDNGIGYPTKAVLDSGKQFVTLTVGDMAPGTTYKLTVSNVKDISGNVIGSSNTYSFPGVASAAAIKPAQIGALNNKQIKVVFNQPVSSSATTRGNYSIAKLDVVAGANDIVPNGTAVGTYVSLQTIDPNAVLTLDSDNKTVTISFSAASGLSMVTGVYGLRTNDGLGNAVVGKFGAPADSTTNATIQFAGTSGARPAVTVTAQAVDTTHATLKFSEKIVTAGLAAQDITFVQDDATGNILYSATVGAIATATDTVTVALNGTDTFVANKVYRVVYKDQTAADKITASNGGFKPSASSPAIAAYLTTTGVTAISKVNVAGATQVESNVIDVTFDQNIKALGYQAATDVTIKTDTDGAIAGLSVVGFKTVTDSKTLRLYTNKDLPTGGSGVFKVVFGTTDGTKVNYANDPGTTVTVASSGATTSKLFARASTDSNPSISSVTAVASDVVKVTFSESIIGTFTENVDLKVLDPDGVQINTFLSLDNSAYTNGGGTTTVTPGTAVAPSNVIYLKVAGTGVFGQGKTYTVQLSGSGTGSSITDLPSNAIKATTVTNKTFAGINTGDTAVLNGVATPAAALPIFDTANGFQVTGASFNQVSVAGAVPVANVPAELYKIEAKASATAPAATTTADANSGYLSAAATNTAGAVAGLTGITKTQGQSIWIRYVDAAGNKSAWVDVEAPHALAYNATASAVADPTSFKLVNATTITIKFSEKLTASKFVASNANGFSIAAGAGVLTSTSLGADGVTVTLTGTVFDATTQVAYTAPGTAADIIDLQGNKLANIAATLVN